MIVEGIFEVVNFTKIDLILLDLEKNVPCFEFVRKNTHANIIFQEFHTTKIYCMILTIYESSPFKNMLYSS